MKFISDGNKDTVNLLISNVETFTEILEMFLDMKTESSILREILQDLNKGIFKILFMGKFNSGKSTLINALVGNSIMATKAIACTAIIATVEYGKNINFVEVVYKPESTRNNDRFTIAKFSSKFSINFEEEKKLIKNGGELSRFKDVSHAKMYSTNDIFADGVQIVDSPGLEENISRTTITKQFLPKANAVIFILDATSIFSDKEKQYISENFLGKNVTNIFFVVNRIDCVVPGQLENVKSQVKNILAEVFKNATGNFDEKLYNKRVFFINAYAAECVRLNQPFKIRVSENLEIEVPITIEETGFLNFESELRIFLNSSERVNAMINSTLYALTSIYEKARKKVDSAKEMRAKDKEERQETLKKAPKYLGQANAICKKTIPTVIKNTADDIAVEVYDDLRLSSVRIKDDFEENYSRAFAKSIDWTSLAWLGTMSTLSSIPFIGKKIVSDEDLKMLAEPIVRFMQWAIKDAFEERMSRLKDRINFEKSLKKSHENVYAQIQNFDMCLEKITGVENNLRSTIAISKLNINISTESTQMPQVQFEMFSFGIKFVSVICSIIMTVVYFIMNPITMPAIIMGVLYYCIKYGLSPDDIKEKLFLLITNRVFEELENHIKSNEYKIKNEIAKSILPLISENYDSILKLAKGLIDDTESWLKKFEDIDNDDEEKNIRDEDNLKKLAAQIKNIRGSV